MKRVMICIVALVLLAGLWPAGAQQGLTQQAALVEYQTGTERVFVDASGAQTVRIPLSGMTVSVERVWMRVRTRPLTATVSIGAAGGGSVDTDRETSHQHMYLRSGDGTALRGPLAEQTFSLIEQGTGTVFHFQALTDAGNAPRFYDLQPAGAHEHTISLDAHTHSLGFGIVRDSQRPAGLSILVDGFNVTPFLPGTVGADLDETYDITGALNGGAGAHVVEIRCSEGRGEVWISWDVVAQINPTP